MNYTDKLRKGTVETGNILCMGLDPQIDFLPQKTTVYETITDFFFPLFVKMKERNLIPASFKPNLGYFSALDRPREGLFEGSSALSDLLDKIEEFFPHSSVILDSKRGDIARSSLNYSIEAFDCWSSDSVTVSPYMGSDSLSPFYREGKGIYVLNRTSNPGGADLQTLSCRETDLADESLYMKTARQIARWADRHPGTGAVVGATSPDELEKIAAFYAANPVPLLIPGVGSQGGTMAEVLSRLKTAAYPLDLVRINVSSGISHPWGKQAAPADWLEQSLTSLTRFIGEAAL